MTRLSREVEQNVLTLHEVAQAVLVAHVGDVHLQTVLKARNVVQAATVLGHEGVDEHDVCVDLDQFAREIRPQEAEAARDQDVLAGEVWGELRCDHEGHAPTALESPSTKTTTAAALQRTTSAPISPLKFDSASANANKPRTNGAGCCPSAERRR